MDLDATSDTIRRRDAYPGFVELSRAVRDRRGRLAIQGASHVFRHRQDAGAVCGSCVIDPGRLLRCFRLGSILPTAITLVPRRTENVTMVELRRPLAGMRVGLR